MFGRTKEVSMESFPDWVSPASVRAVGDNIGSSSPSAAKMLSRFSSKLGSESGIMVPGLEFRRVNDDGELAGGCIGGGMISWAGRMPVVSTVRRVEVSVLMGIAGGIFGLATCCAFSKATISSSCKGTGVSAYEKKNESLS